MWPYATVQDVRDTGVTVMQASDDVVEDLLEMASRRIEQVAEQKFHPRRATHVFDGESHQTLVLHEPLISLEEVRVVDVINRDGDASLFELTDIVVYDRDNSRGQIASGDGFASRLRLLRDVFWHVHVASSVFPLGQQNIQVIGVWGRTESRRGYADTGVETFDLDDGDDLQVQIDGALDEAGVDVVQIVTFVTADFPDINVVTADQLSGVLNERLTGVLARGREIVGGRVARLTSELRAYPSRVRVVGGTAASKLGLSIASEVFWPDGETPARITEACVRLVRLALGLSASSGNQDGSQPGDPGPIKSRRTRSQRVDFASDSGVNQHHTRGSVTGDPVVDYILTIEFSRPPRLAVPRAATTGRYPFR